MWKSLKTLLLMEKSNRSNIYTFLVVALLIGAYIYIASDEEFNNPLGDSTEEYQSASSALGKYQVVDLNEPESANSMFGRLTRLRQAIALKQAALKMENDRLIFEASKKVIQLRNEVYEQEDYEEVADLIPPKIHSDNENLFIEKLEEKNISLHQDSLQYWQFLLLIFGILGFVWFPFLSVYTSGIMIDDFQHSTVIKGYPVRFDQYVIAKSITKLIMIFSFIALIFIISTPLLYFKGAGEVSYPVVVYSGSPQALTIPKYILLCLAFMIIIAIFTVLFSIVLNMLFKNMYITMFIQMILFFMPILFPRLISAIPYNPFNFLSFQSILDGDSLGLKNPVDLQYTDAFIVLFITIVILIFVVKRFLSTGKLQKA